jgi:pyruvate/2-oxoglutarate dehydrogenase complex dihydrolipoamide acyltransferase (E2) component
MTDSTLDVRSVHSCTGVKGAVPDEPSDTDEFVGADRPGAAAPGPVVVATPLSTEPAAGAPASPVDGDPELVKATVPAVAAPPAATRPASDHATAFIEIRFISGRFGIFLFLGVAA